MKQRTIERKAIADTFQSLNILIQHLKPPPPLRDALSNFYQLGYSGKFESKSESCCGVYFLLSGFGGVNYF